MLASYIIEIYRMGLYSIASLGEPEKVMLTDSFFHDSELNGSFPT